MPPSVYLLKTEVLSLVLTEVDILTSANISSGLFTALLYHLIKKLSVAIAYCQKLPVFHYMDLEEANLIKEFDEITKILHAGLFCIILWQNCVQKCINCLFSLSSCGM